MKLFQHSQGFILAFGFNMTERKPDANRIMWCDPTSLSWGMSAANLAGCIRLPFVVNPEFVHECRDGVVVAYQPGKCIELTPAGTPYIWTFRVLKAQEA